MVNVHCSFSQDTSICQVLLFHNTEASSNPLGNIASVILRLVKQESGTCVGTLLAEDAMFIELHDGALPPVKPFDWTPFDTLPEEPHDITFNLP